jgi:hypothetical protein
VDASFVKESNSTSWGAVIRDHLGQIGLSAWGFIRECDSAEIAEAIACLEDVKQTLNWVESDLIIESDCAAVIKKARSNERDRSHTSSITVDIQRLVTNVT